MGLETPLCPGEATSGKLILFRTDFPFTTPQKAVSASLRPSCAGSLQLGLPVLPGQLSASDPQRSNWRRTWIRALDFFSPPTKPDLQTWGVRELLGSQPLRPFSAQRPQGHLDPLATPPPPSIGFRQSRPRAPNLTALTVFWCQRVIKTFRNRAGKVTSEKEKEECNGYCLLCAPGAMSD